MAYQQPTDNPMKHRFTEYGQDRIQVARWLVQVRDAYNLVYVYTMIHDWLVEEGWASNNDADFGETYYTQRDHPKHGKEVWIRWRLERMPDAAKGTLFSYTMDLNFKIIGLKSTEIVWKGQKIKADRSEIEIECISSLIVDKGKEWKSWPFSSIKAAWINRVLRQQKSKHRKHIYADTYRLRDLIMNYLKLETFMPVKEAGEFYLKRTLE